MQGGPTANLLTEPRESLARQLLLGSAVGECVGDRYVGVVFEDGALHRQLVQISIEEGYDTFREGRRPVEIHDGRCCRATLSNRSGSFLKGMRGAPLCRSELSNNNQGTKRCF